MSDWFWQRFIISHNFLSSRRSSTSSCHSSGSSSSLQQLSLQSLSLLLSDPLVSEEMTFKQKQQNKFSLMMCRKNLHCMYVQYKYMYHVYNCVQLYYFSLFTVCRSDCCISKATINIHSIICSRLL